MSVLQFVDSIAAQPGLRLDLNNRRPITIKEMDFGYPELSQATVETMLQDDGHVPASSMGLRTITLELNILAGSPEAQATAKQKLHRELDRPENFLKWQVGSDPVFFRTFRAAPGSIRWYKDGNRNSAVTVQIKAKPFALGLEEFAFADVSVDQDPAAASGCFVDVGSVKGDVETPLVLSSTAGSSLYQSVFAVRRRHITLTPFLLQAEAMTQGTDTTTQPNSGTMSGSGNNYSRCTFASNAALATRLSVLEHPSTGSVGARGTYQVYARVQRSSATGTVNVKLGSNPLVPTLLSVSKHILYLGEFSIPSGGGDPVTHGASGVELPVEGAPVTFQAERLSGTSNLDVDFFLFVPADDRHCVITWPGGGAPGTVGFDGVNRAVFRKDSGTGGIVSNTGFHVGGLPAVSPGVTNRLYFVKHVGLAELSGLASIVLTATYWPRYLMDRPPGS